jgi:hypothetical protein
MSGPEALPEPGQCPNCGAIVAVNDLFCDQCGHDLPAASGFPIPPQRPAAPSTDMPGSAAADQGIIVLADRPAGSPVEGAAAEPYNEPSPNPRLLIEPAGMPLPLPADRDAYVIGREDPASGSYPDVDLVPYGGEEGGVSRRHAQISRRGSAFFIEDLNSVNYTFVNRQKLAAGVAHPLRDGDEIRLGRVFMRFKTR